MEYTKTWDGISPPSISNSDRNCTPDNLSLSACLHKVEGVHWVYVKDKKALAHVIREGGGL